MDRFIDHITTFIISEGFSCSHLRRYGLDFICVTLADGKNKKILPLDISASSTEQARMRAEDIEESITSMVTTDKEYPLIVTQDRWNTQRQMMQERLLAHLEVFTPVYARNCEVRRIDRSVAREFLDQNHSYGHAACRYCYGLFFKRHTGHIAQNIDAEIKSKITTGQLVAVATFSNARKWIKGDKTIRSYEWTRYASLPHIRLSGGMGRILKEFIKEVQPDDIMSYADLEWSEGNVYGQLGFELEGQKEPVMFQVGCDWKRMPVKTNEAALATVSDTEQTITRFFQNFGSNKYRLKLTDYK